MKMEVSFIYIKKNVWVIYEKYYSYKSNFLLKCLNKNLLLNRN